VLLVVVVLLLLLTPPLAWKVPVVPLPHCSLARSTHLSRSQCTASSYPRSLH